VEKLSVSENFKVKVKHLDVGELIKRLLSTGAKTPKELREAVISKTGLSDRVYYRHLKRMLESKEVEEILEEENGGRKIKKYSLRWKESLLVKAPAKGIVYYSPEFVVSRRLLELASWIKQEPEGWVDNQDVEKAKQLLNHYLLPEIKSSYEDPDIYVFVWSHEKKSNLNLADFIHSRFFNLKDVYNSVAETLETEKDFSRDVFVGVYYSPFIAEHMTSFENLEEQMQYVGKPSELIVNEKPQSISIAVGKRRDGSMLVIHVESREGEIDKAWVKGLAQQLRAKKFQIYNYISEDVRRKLLINLRETLKQHKVLIPKKYVKLIEELLDYSYKKPSSGYVLALAIAVDLCQKE
jgi:hypothetical protein